MALPLEQAKAERNAAHRAFQSQLAQVQEDLSMRSIGGRMADRAGAVLVEAGEVASENKGVVAGTIAAIALWFLRGPIIRLVASFWADADDTERKAEDD